MSGNKICEIIIDGGSCENMVSGEMVKKLGLYRQQHERPYQISWFKKGTEIHVKEKCLVTI